MTTESQYRHHEAALFNADLRRIETAPLADRQAARTEFAAALRDSPELVATRIDWLLNGSYGAGAYHAAQEVAANVRTNRAAWLCQTIAALEWQCPAEFARQAWKTLTPPQKATLAALIGEELEYNRTERAEQ